MKINWGTGIFISFVLFALFILSFVFRSFQHEVNLVSTDYYEQEIAHEEKITKKKNENNLLEKIQVNNTETYVELVFPIEYASKIDAASVYFFRPSDFNKDKTFAINLNEEGFQTFDKKLFDSGKYKIKVEWKMDNMAFYKEFDVFL